MQDTNREHEMSLKSDYSFFTKLKLSLWLLRTKILFPCARLIRFPIDLRGRRMIAVGKGFTTGRYCRIEAFISNFDNERELPIKIRIGDGVQINDCVHISAVESVVIGNNVLIAGNCYISDNSHGFYKESDLTPGGVISDPGIAPKERPYKHEPVIIEDNVWIGEGVLVIPGVKIGYGSIVGAHSVVTNNLPEKCMAVGSPAKVIKYYDDKTQKWITV